MKDPFGDSEKYGSFITKDKSTRKFNRNPDNDVC
jgi:hypothetical protein